MNKGFLPVGFSIRKAEVKAPSHVKESEGCDFEYIKRVEIVALLWHFRNSELMDWERSCSGENSIHFCDKNCDKTARKAQKSGSF